MTTKHEETDKPSPHDRVLYKGEWMSRTGAERERSIEHLHGSVTILGYIVSPIDYGPLHGSVIDEGDIISPIEAEWEAECDSDVEVEQVSKQFYDKT